MFPLISQHERSPDYSKSIAVQRLMAIFSPKKIAAGPASSP